MNYTIDLVNNWAQKLTYRIMQISGASEQALSNYVKEVAKIKDNKYEADKTIQPGLRLPKIVEYIVYAGIVAGCYFAYKFLKRKKII